MHCVSKEQNPSFVVIIWTSSIQFQQVATVTIARAHIAASTMLFNGWVTPKKLLLPVGDLDSHGFLGPKDSTPQTAFRSVRTFFGASFCLSPDLNPFNYKTSGVMRQHADTRVNKQRPAEVSWVVYKHSTDDTAINEWEKASQVHISKKGTLQTSAVSSLMTEENCQPSGMFSESGIRVKKMRFPYSLLSDTAEAVLRWHLKINQF